MELAVKPQIHAVNPHLITQLAAVRPLAPAANYM